ncbi:MAG: hypothetical protein ACD_20C00091G0003 [uncultured bacterium]|nr:MAG: hypothetical protein ACD_20C00091G0003 [uncultured bacterium]HBH17853.1 hypothetical protein [Cyanobacteria bacterium UBA9579]
MCALNDERSDIASNKVNIREITVESRDGLNMTVQFYSPKIESKYPTVLMLPMLGKTGSSWNNFISILLNNGFAVCNVDLRGHGRSVRMKNGKEVFYQNMNEQDWKKIPEDVADLIDFISKDKFVDPNRLGIAGASIGANSAIIVASRYPNKAKTLIALSPGINYKGLETLEPAKNLKIPVLIAVGSEDDYAYKSSNQLNEVVKTTHNLLIYKNSEHGSDLLNKSEDLQRKIVDWLDEYLKK